MASRCLAHLVRYIHGSLCAPYEMLRKRLGDVIIDTVSDVRHSRQPSVAGVTMQAIG